MDIHIIDNVIYLNSLPIELFLTNIDGGWSVFPPLIYDFAHRVEIGECDNAWPSPTL